MSYTVQLVLIGTGVLGISCGVLGVFIFHQKQSLISDALSHATLPGIAIAYLILVALQMPERSLGAFISGALASTGLCIVLYRLLRRLPMIHSDAIIAILLSSFFGLGVALLGIIQKQPRGHAAGLNQYIYGDAAGLLQSDILVIAITAAAVALVIALLFKEIVVTTFDREYARSIGVRTNAIEGLLLLLTVCITIVGLQAVGLILMVALLIIPALAARYWTQQIGGHLVMAALFGIVGTTVGTITSATWGQLPTGAAITLSTGMLFVISILCGTHNGLLRLSLSRRSIRREFNLIQLLIALRFRFDIPNFLVARDRAAYLDLHGAITHHWIADHVQIDTRARNRTIRLACTRALLTVVDRNSYKITATGVDAMRQALYRHQLIDIGMRLFPARTVTLQETSDARAEELFDEAEMTALTAYMSAHYPYLLPQETA